MLREETVEKGTMDLIRQLMADEKFAAFNLVGGTALALTIGHRKSIDIDLFSDLDFDSKSLSIHLSSSYNVTRQQVLNKGIFSLIDGIKVDLLTHKYPKVEEIQILEGIRMASLKDIGAMKLNAIFGNGTRLKDFVDVYALLEKFTLDDLLKASQIKYPENNIKMVKNALQHFQDIDFTVPVMYTNQKFNWSLIAERLKKAILEPNKVFKSQVIDQKSILQKNNRKQKKPKGPHL